MAGVYHGSASKAHCATAQVCVCVCGLCYILHDITVKISRMKLLFFHHNGGDISNCCCFFFSRNDSKGFEGVEYRYDVQFGDGF